MAEMNAVLLSHVDLESRVSLNIKITTVANTVRCHPLLKGHYDTL